MDYYLGKALENTEGFLDINEIRKLLKEETGVLFHSRTIETYNDRYADEYGMGPLCQFKGRYKLNRCLYKLIKIDAHKINCPPESRKPGYLSREAIRYLLSCED